ncbi:hypothetical protein EVAR_71333_1 [Eumeta japonica]|uniref:Uncharacterized protein n=1 Tax=Eumeta variegata TaxID=151549 RepID=A0A4C2A9A8_EUMVA|nr:hypothetical protein EVAR_71333_1 [Eumeta japonica]
MLSLLAETSLQENNSCRSTVVDLATAQTETKEIMKAETAQPNETIEKSACAGEGFTILLTQAGSILSCGDNSKYALDFADNKTFHSPKIIEALENYQITEIKAGTTHVLALSADGSIFTWGTNVQGALGLGSLQTQQ